MRGNSIFWIGAEPLGARCSGADPSPFSPARLRFGGVPRAQQPVPKLTREAEMTTHLQSEQIEEGLSRRGLVQALAAGAAAASVATPASAQQTSAPQVLAEANA